MKSDREVSERLVRHELFAHVGSDVWAVADKSALLQMTEAK